MAKKKVVKEEVQPEVKVEEEIKAEPEVVNPVIEEPKECPANACQELADIWEKGEGCYDASSKWCKECEKEFADTAIICKERTEKISVEKKEKVKGTRSPRRTRGNVSVWNHGLNIQAGVIDGHIINSGAKLDDMVDELIEKGLSTRDKTTTKRRILGHISHLKKDHGVLISTEGGIYKQKAA